MWALTLLLPLLPHVAATVVACPPLGPTLPTAANLSGNAAVQQALSGIKQALDNFTNPFNATAFSLTIGSTQSQAPLFEYSNNPTVYNTSGAHSVNTDTQFAVASVSKLFTAYGIKLLSPAVNGNDPITKFVPDLGSLSAPGIPRNAITTTNWDEVTIDSLLSHLSGIADDLGDSDIDNAPGNYSALGLPMLNASQEGLQCGDANSPYQRPCTESDFFDNWGRKYPAYAPFTTPVYSNIGYALLGLVIEQVSNSSYVQFMKDTIFEPLNLAHTSVDLPLNLSDAFITSQPGDGDSSEGFLASAGGIYSSSKDLFRLGQAILNATLLSPTATRAWLEPRTFTSSPSTFVGEVWEIARGTNLTGGNGQIVDVYTKSGNLYLYSSVLALVPDYNLTISMTSGGPDTNAGVIQVLLSQILEALIPAMESANKQAATALYVGTYTSGNDSISLAVDEGPGLVVQNFTINGVNDVIDQVGALMGASGIGNTSLRLYPTNLVAGSQMAWQGVYDTLSPTEAAQENAMLFFTDGTCQSWSELALLSYGTRPLDQFIFTYDDAGKNVAVDARAWRAVMTRQ